MRYFKPSGCQDSRIRGGILLTLFLAKVYLAFSVKVFELFDLQMTVASMLLDEECFLVLMLAQLWLGQAFLILLILDIFRSIIASDFREFQQQFSLFRHENTYVVHTH